MTSRRRRTESAGIARVLAWVAVVAISIGGAERVRAEVFAVPADFASIQDALASAASGDEIEVAAGTWLGAIDFLGKDVVLRSVDGPSVTILDADGAGATVSFRNGESPAARLEGFTVTGGTGASFGTTLFGGGIYCNGASPTLVGNVIEGNRAQLGGGIACLGGAAPEIRDTVLRSNVAEIVEPVALGRGGALYAEQAFPFLVDSRVEQNFAEFRGGGVFADLGSAILLESSVFVRNTTLVEGGAIAVIGDSQATLLDNDFVENHAGTRGGAVHAAEATVRILGNRFTSNTSGFDAGAVSLMEETDASEAVRNRIEGNRAERSGGAILVHGSRPLLAGNVIAFNESGASGVGAGGALTAAVGARPRLVNETYYGNRSEAGGSAIYAYGLSRPNLVNGILWNPGSPDGEILIESGGGVLATTSIIRGGWPGEGNSSLDPRFVDAASGVFEPRLDSPAVDAGVTSVLDLPELDLDGDLRVADGGRGSGATVDLGAQEMRPGVAVRFGTTGASAGRVEAVLSVNGSVGDRERRIALDVRAPIAVELAAPSAGPVPAPFVLYAWEGSPDLATLSPLPLGVGTLGLAGPLDGGRPRRVWNNFGHRRRLGFPDLPSTPAPSRVVDAPRGIGRPLEFYLQGIVVDDGSEAEVPASVTNGIVVEVGF